MRMKKIAVVILNWNGEALLRKFLPSVLRHSPEETADVIVADNGSTDGSVEMLRNEFPHVRLILLEKNYGFAEGYNRALEQIDHPYTVLLNSDVEVTPNWLDSPLSLLESRADIAAVQPKLLSYRQPDYFEYAGAAGGFLDKYGYPYCRGRIFDVVEKDEGQYNDICPIFWATGACLFIRTDVYKEAGGLDADFFAHQEEIDLCWRLRTRGYQIFYTPQSVVYHVGGATLDAENPRKTFLNFRNNLLMLYKNLLAKDMQKVMRVRLVLDYVAAFKFLISGHPANAKAVYQARKEFHKLKAEFWEKRKENLSKRKLRQIPEQYDGSLLVAFYLKGRRRFKELTR